MILFTLESRVQRYEIKTTWQAFPLHFYRKIRNTNDNQHVAHTLNQAHKNARFSVRKPKKGPKSQVCNRLIYSVQQVIGFAQVFTWQVYGRSRPGDGGAARRQRSAGGSNYLCHCFRAHRFRAFDFSQRQMCACRHAGKHPNIEHTVSAPYE